MLRSIIIVSGAILLRLTVPAAAEAGLSALDYQRCDDLSKRFNEARARQDVEGMAAVFAEDAVRVTPDGVLRGRDAIRRNLETLVKAGLHDFTSQRTISHNEGNLVFDAGEWHAKLGDVPLHGYYSAILSCGGDKPEIREETTNVATPPR